MAILCNSRDIVGLRAIRKKTMMRLYPSWQVNVGNFDPEHSVNNHPWYSGVQDYQNGNTLPQNSHAYTRIMPSSNFQPDRNPDNIDFAVQCQHYSDEGAAGVWVNADDWGTSSERNANDDGTIYTKYVIMGIRVSDSRFFPLIFERNKFWKLYYCQWEPYAVVKKYENNLLNEGDLGYPTYASPQYSGYVETTVFESDTVRTFQQYSTASKTDSISVEVPDNTYESFTYENSGGTQVTIMKKDVYYAYELTYANLTIKVNSFIHA